MATLALPVFLPPFRCSTPLGYARVHRPCSSTPRSTYAKPATIDAQLANCTPRLVASPAQPAAVAPTTTSPVSAILTSTMMALPLPARPATILATPALHQLLLPVSLVILLQIATFPQGHASARLTITTTEP